MYIVDSVGQRGEVEHDLPAFGGKRQFTLRQRPGVVLASHLDGGLLRRADRRGIRPADGQFVERRIIGNGGGLLARKAVAEAPRGTGAGKEQQDWHH